MRSRLLAEYPEAGLVQHFSGRLIGSHVKAVLALSGAGEPPAVDTGNHFGHSRSRPVEDRQNLVTAHWAKLAAIG